ncbi:amino acid permease, partial [Winogradskyella poriferorum]|uniref:amino acid permease n=1 Tax=Winogradskyella poriferorum TaxID=307627 RepID=UPI003D64F7BF
IAFLALSLIPSTVIVENQDSLLSLMGRKASGPWLCVLIGIDASLVLGGAALTSFVGVGGLMRRMALDRILPKPLLTRNSRG